MNRTLSNLVLLSALLAAGCGYSSGPMVGGGSGEHTVRTIWVPIVSNELHRRQVEEPLTDAVIKEIQAITDLAVVSEDQDPDSVLKLELINVQERTSVENLLDVVVQGTVQFSIAVTWTDRRTGEEIPLVKTLVTDARTFTATRGETFATASAEVAEKIAEKVVESMYRAMQ